MKLPLLKFGLGFFVLGLLTGSCGKDTEPENVSGVGEGHSLFRGLEGKFEFAGRFFRMERQFRKDPERTFDPPDYFFQDDFFQDGSEWVLYIKEAMGDSPVLYLLEHREQEWLIRLKQGIYFGPGMGPGQPVIKDYNFDGIKDFGIHFSTSNGMATEFFHAWLRKGDQFIYIPGFADAGTPFLIPGKKQIRFLNACCAGSEWWYTNCRWEGNRLVEIDSCVIENYPYEQTYYRYTGKKGNMKLVEQKSPVPQGLLEEVQEQFDTAKR